MLYSIIVLHEYVESHELVWYTWYVSNVSIIFDYSMLLYNMFWMFMGFIIHFYIIFGTNLLTGGPAQIVVFLPILVFWRRKNIKRSPNKMKPSGELFFERKQSRRLGVYVREATRKARGRGRAHPPVRALHPRAALVAPLTNFFRLYISIYPENI